MKQAFLQQSSEEILEACIAHIAEANSSYSGWTENEEVDYREFCIYAMEQLALDEELAKFNSLTSSCVGYDITEKFVDGNGMECIYLKCK
jgi:hypothetical protein